MTIDLSTSKSHWPLRIKLLRALWSFLLQPLVCWLPKPCSPVRILALRLMGAYIGKGCLVASGVRVLMPWNLRLGDYSVVGESAILYNYAPIDIGTQTVISQLAHLCTGSHDYTRSDFPLIYSPIVVGQQVWVAAGVYVGPGVTIADGVVVGAMSVVTRSLADAWTVYAGNPCRPLKPRPHPTPLGIRRGL